MPTPSYTAIPDSWVDAESPVTVSLMTRLRDNPEAIAGGATGATRIQTGAIATAAVTGAKIANLAVDTAQLAAGAVTNAKLAANAVKQGNIDVTGTSAGGTLAGGGSATYAFTVNSDYAFYPKTYTDGETYDAYISYTGSASSATLSIGFVNQGASSHIILAIAKYVTASPPYDLGDGNVPLFVYALLGANDEILHINVSEEPPWAYIGPHSSKADFYRDGRPFKRVPRLPCSFEEARRDPRKLPAYIEALKRGEFDEVEITLAYKNLDAHLMPHPFVTGIPGRVVLLDPVSPVMEQLRGLMRAGDDVGTLLLKQYLRITGPVARRAPPGVPVVGVDWRLTGA